MHDIWNPWHGCIKKSEGCQNCYMYAIDAARGLDGSNIYRVKQNFDLPVQRFRDGLYKIPPGAHIRVCMNSDFFLAEADEWRPAAWDFIRQRPDVLFWLLTKRPERVAAVLPPDWGEGWDNVALNVTTENQRRADERLPILLSLPAKHKGLMAAPFLGPVHIEKYLATGQLEYITSGGENYAGARPCRYEWVESLYRQAVDYDVDFDFYETGEWFIKDGKTYHISRSQQRQQAIKSGLRHRGRPTEFKLSPAGGQLSFSDAPPARHYGRRCRDCREKEGCLGCIGCGQC